MAHNQEATGLLRETSTEPATQRGPHCLNTHARKSPNCANKDGGFICKEEKNQWFSFKQILQLFEYYCNAKPVYYFKPVYYSKPVYQMKLLTSVGQIFYCQDFDWLFNLWEIQQRKTVINDLQESLSADPLCCVFVHTHSPISVHALTIRLVFHKQMLTQDSCSSDISVLNYSFSPGACTRMLIFFFVFKVVLACLCASETWQLSLIPQTCKIKRNKRVNFVITGFGILTCKYILSLIQRKM